MNAERIATALNGKRIRNHLASYIEQTVKPWLKNVIVDAGIHVYLPRKMADNLIRLLKLKAV